MTEEEIVEKFKTTLKFRYLTLVSLAIGILVIVLLYFLFPHYSGPYGKKLLTFFVIAAVIVFIVPCVLHVMFFWRCPNCNSILNKNAVSPKECFHCKAKLKRQ